MVGTFILVECTLTPWGNRDPFCLRRFRQGFAIGWFSKANKKLVAKTHFSCSFDDRPQLTNPCQEMHDKMVSAWHYSSKSHMTGG